MLPILMYSAMEGSSNSTNNLSANFGQSFDSSVILNSVRSRKKVTDLPNCPVCSCTIRQGELESHMALEVERLQKLSNGGTKRKLSATSPTTSGAAVAGSSSSVDAQEEQEVDVTGCLGSDVYQRVHSNRMKRLRSRRRAASPTEMGECPVCRVRLPIRKLQRHALKCLTNGAEGASEEDDDDASIDVENDEPSGGFGAEYEWCGETRVRAAALQMMQEPRDSTLTRVAPNDDPLVVDGDEDTELYGAPQYSPSRIAPNAEIIHPDNSSQHDEQTDTQNRVQTNSLEIQHNTKKLEYCRTEPCDIIDASAETRIEALKAKIIELEKKQNGSSEAKCLICLSSYVSPAVSIQCWHVYCEVCWLQSLRAKKICPQCNLITTTQHLRRIYI